jgi:membrane-associated phospholipid phosphatase
VAPAEFLYCPLLRVSRAIRVTAWGLLGTGVLAPALRRRVALPRPLILGLAGAAPLAAYAVLPPRRSRTVAVCALNMWAYLAAYEMPHDDPERLAARVHVRYPLVIDRALGLGTIPTLRLQRAFSTPGRTNRFERLLAGCHWVWFAVPHTSVAYVLWRDPERLARSAARMYAVFDLGAVFYWTIPTAPPWWAATRGGLRDEDLRQLRRMMIEYGPEFWGPLWEPLFKLLGGNPLAAMPSLHFATSLMGAHLLSEVGPVAGLVSWGYALMLGLALVYLGEHYAIDLIAGAALTESVRAAAPALAPAVKRTVALLDVVAGRAAAGR